MSCRCLTNSYIVVFAKRNYRNYLSVRESARSRTQKRDDYLKQALSVVLYMPEINLPVIFAACNICHCLNYVKSGQFSVSKIKTTTLINVAFWAFKNECLFNMCYVSFLLIHFLWRSAHLFYFVACLLSNFHIQNLVLA